MPFTKICTIEFSIPSADGSVSLLVRNEVTGMEEKKIYKTEAAARGAATRFENRMMRVYGRTVPNWCMERLQAHG